MSKICTLINGAPSDRISASNRAFLFGEGLFETLSIHEGKPALLADHLARMNEGCATLGWEKESLSTWQGYLDQALGMARNPSFAVARMMLSYLNEDRGYQSPIGKAERVLWLYPQKHASLHRLPPCALQIAKSSLHKSDFTHIKHSSRIDYALCARGTGKGYDDALLLDEKQNVIESTTANLFAVMDEKTLITPCLKEYGLSGTMRNFLLRTPTDITIRVETLSLDALFSAEAVFVTNSVIGIREVSHIDDKSFRLGHPLVKDLQKRTYQGLGLCAKP